MAKINKYLILLQLILLNIVGQSLIHCAAQIETDQTCFKFTSVAEAIEKIKHLIKHGANVNIVDDSGSDWTPLIIAARFGPKEIVESLIKANAAVNTANKSGNTALIYAAANGNKEIVELLIKAHADVNVANKSGDTALTDAGRMGNKEMVELLIKQGVNINAADKSGYTALIWAVVRYHPEIVELLLKAGADIDHKNKSDEKAIDCARMSGYQKLVQMLEDEPQRRENKILECQKVISNQITNLPDKPLINDVIPLISQYTVGNYQDAIEFEKNNPNIIEMLLQANASLNSSNKLKRKADAENTDDSDEVYKRYKLSQSAILSLINELKEKRENIHKEIAALGMNIDNMGLIEAKEEEIVNINQKIESLEKQLNEI